MVESLSPVDSVVIRPETQTNVEKWKGSFTDHLANERTFLAWTRTSLGIFAFGCAIARFGGTNNTQITLKGPFSEMKPITSGLILIACGISTLFYSIYRYYRINRQIIEKDLTEASQIREPVIATLVLLLSMISILIIFIIL